MNIAFAVYGEPAFSDYAAYQLVRDFEALRPYGIKTTVFVHSWTGTTKYQYRGSRAQLPIQTLTADLKNFWRTDNVVVEKELQYSPVNRSLMSLNAVLGTVNPEEFDLVVATKHNRLHSDFGNPLWARIALDLYIARDPKFIVANEISTYKNELTADTSRMMFHPYIIYEVGKLLDSNEFNPADYGDNLINHLMWAIGGRFGAFAYDGVLPFDIGPAIPLVDGVERFSKQTLTPEVAAKLAGVSYRRLPK